MVMKKGADILRNVNLNLLPILQLLLKTRSVSATATVLGISQPAVSDALARLRAMLEDQLLVRVGSRMHLTGYAEQLIDPLDKICATLEEFLSKDEFDPKTAQREFVIATSDLGAYLLARPMLNMLITQAPGISLRLIDIGHDLTTRMASREIDIALLPEFALEDLAPAPLRFQAVIDMPHVALMRKGHPLTKLDCVRAEDMAKYKHISFYPDPILKPSHRMQMVTDGLEVQVVARMEQTLLIPHMLPKTDFVAIVHKQFADDMADMLELESRPLTYFKAAVPFGFAWSPVLDRDPAHAWFRAAVLQHIREVAGGN